MSSKIALPVSRDGNTQVTNSDWDHNGSFRVTVVARKVDFDGRSQTNALNRARRLAKKVDKMDKVQWVRLDGQGGAEDGEGTTTMTYRFTVSRLDRSYR